MIPVDAETPHRDVRGRPRKVLGPLATLSSLPLLCASKGVCCGNPDACSQPSLKLTQVTPASGGSPSTWSTDSKVHVPLARQSFAASWPGQNRRRVKVPSGRRSTSPRPGVSQGSPAYLTVVVPAKRPKAQGGGTPRPGGASFVGPAHAANTERTPAEYARIMQLGILASTRGCGSRQAQGVC